MKIRGINKGIRKMVFIGALSTLALFRTNNSVHAEEIGKASDSSIEIDSNESRIEDISNAQLKTEVEEAETTVAKARLEKLEDKKVKVFAYKEFLNENVDGEWNNDVIIAYSTDKGYIRLNSGENHIKEDIDLKVLSDIEKNKIFEIVKTEYTKYIESKDWNEAKKEEFLRFNLQEFEKTLGIYKTPTEAHFFTEVEEAEDADLWYELTKVELKEEKRVIKLEGSSESKELETPKRTQKNTILACVEYTDSEGERTIAYMYIANNSKSGTIRCTELEGLTDEEKQKLYELASERYEQILESKDKKKYKYIDKWDSKMDVREESQRATCTNRHTPEKEGSTSEKIIPMKGLEKMTLGVRSEEINEWIDTLEKEVNHVGENLINGRDEENEK